MLLRYYSLATGITTRLFLTLLLHPNPSNVVGMIVIATTGIPIIMSIVLLVYGYCVPRP